MSVAYPAERVGVVYQLEENAQQRRQTADVINRNNQGQMNCGLFVTLDPSVATTTVMDPRISVQTCLALCPVTANAAAAIPTTWVVPTNGQAVFHHASNGQTDRTFHVALLG